MMIGDPAERVTEPSKGGGRTTLSDQRTIGSITVDFEAPDTVLFGSVGPISEVEIRGLDAFMSEQKAKGHPLRYLLIDSSRAGDFKLAARRAMLDVAKNHPGFVTVIHQASFTTRVSTELVTNAIRMVTGGPPTVSMHDTEASARAWIRENRAASAG